MVVVDDQGDFSAFYRAHFDDTARRLRPLAEDAAEDVVQEAFVALLERWHEVGRYDAPIAWVRLVATRLALRRLHRDQKRIALHENLGAETDDGSSNLDLRSAIATLPSEQAAAIEMHHLKDRPVGEVARALDCSISAAKVRLHRGRSRLAERLGGYRGRWISEATWSVDDVAAHLIRTGWTEHVDVVVEELGAHGGRWELTLADGRYILERDDGLLLDRGRFAIHGRGLVLSPSPAPGHVVLGATVDGERVVFDLRENTTPPTRGVPDNVWMGLFLEASPMGWAGAPRPRSV